VGLHYYFKSTASDNVANDFKRPAPRKDNWDKLFDMRDVMLALGWRLRRLVERCIVFALPLIMNRSLKTGLYAVWHRGDWWALPKTGMIFAANHPSWWDLYLFWLIRQKLNRPVSGMMREDTLATFPFFRPLGVIARSEVREALKRIKRGDVLQIFPQGEMHPGLVTELHEGVAFFAEKSGAPVYPVALRLVVRGAQQPEAFIVLGKPLVFSGTRLEFLEQLKIEINMLLESTDHIIQTTHPEAKPEGFSNWLAERKRFDERIKWLQKLWQR
jgi:1-acyl-sn-glycerol-3-phosphate acyltransferase